jgi:hypothetical protein
LQQGLQQDPVQMAGPIAVRPSPLAGLAKGLMAYQGAKGLNDADSEINNIAQSRESADSEALQKGMALLNSGDMQGAMTAFSATPKGQAYASELLKSTLEDKRNSNKPLDLGDVSKFTPDSVSKFQQSHNYGDLMPYVKPEVITPYQQQQLNIDRDRLNQTGSNAANERAYRQQQLDLQKQELDLKKSTAKQPANDTAKVLAQYEAAKTGLLSGLENTNTGPLIGRAPAFTTDQQVAEGAVSAMAPVLKQLFRASGEGTFTDRDQELLLKMVPTRIDTPEARKIKMANIDNIVRAKLGAAAPPGAGAVAPGAGSRFQVEVVP